MKHTFISLIICLLMLGACKESSKSGSSSTNSTSTQTLEEEYAEFCEQIETSINSGKSFFFNERFLLNELMVNVIDVADAEEDYREGFIAGVGASLDVGGEITHSMGFSGYYTFLKLLEVKDNTATALFRLVTEGSLNYHELYLKKDADDRVNIVDMYVYMGGEKLSITLQRLYLAGLTEGEHEYNITDAKAKAFKETMPVMQKIEAELEEANFQEALDLIEEVPKQMRNDKFILFYEMDIAGKISDDRYMEAADRFKKYYPKDPALDLILIDYYLYKKDTESAINVIDGLDKKLKGEPYLKVVKAQILLDKGDQEKAIALLNESLTEESDNDEAYWMLAEIYIKNKDYEQYLTVMDRMYAEFDVNPMEFFNPEQYPEVYEQQIVKDWLVKNPIPEEEIEFKELDSHEGHDHGHDHSGHGHDHLHEGHHH